MTKSKTKARPKDYNKDLRFAPAPETATRAELLVKAAVSGGAPRREPSKGDEKKIVLL